MERARVLFVHGWTNRRWPGHWQRRAVAALRTAGDIVAYPQLPTPDSPVLSDWLDVVTTELELLREAEGDDVVVIAHSLGCLTWLHAARQGVVGAVDRVLLVAPADPDLCGEVPTFQLDPGEHGLASAVHAAARDTHIVASDADPWLPRGARDTFAEPLGLPVTIVPGAQHFAIEDGWGPWQGVIDWVHDPTVDLATR